MSAEIAQAFGVKPELVKGDSGVFDVVADGKLVFSKHKVHRFPNPGEVAQTLGKLGGERR